MSEQEFAHHVGNPQPNPPAEPEATPEPKAEGGRFFSQDDVDRIVRERLARAKATPPADYEELKTAAARLAEIEEANKTELEREREARAAAEAERDKIRTDAMETRLRAAIIAEAAKPDRKVVDMETVVQLLDRSTLELDDSGAPTNVAEAMDQLLEAKPFLVANGGARAGGADQGARSGGGPKQITREQLKDMTPDQINEARAAGQLDQVLAGG